MRAVATEAFHDRVMGMRREAGDEFECTEARMEELVSAGVARPASGKAEKKRGE